MNCQSGGGLIEGSRQLLSTSTREKTTRACLKCIDQAAADLWQPFMCFLRHEMSKGGLASPTSAQHPWTP